MLKFLAVMALPLALPAADPPPVRAGKCVLKPGVSEAQASAGLCGFDRARLAFAGAPVEQARCLTRHVGQGGVIGAPELPNALAKLVGQPIAVDAARLRQYLATIAASDNQLGGRLDQPVAAGYFIIHDTSFPNCSARDADPRYCPAGDAFPPGRDTPGWLANRNFIARPKPAPNRVANVFVNRVGGSVTEVDLAEPFYTTKFEQCENGKAAIGRFVGVENIQPRLSSVRPGDGVTVDDLAAPDPGFTDAQYDRLALVFIAASVRHGRWLIPAYHAVLDRYYLAGHDDPQKFEIAKFAAAVSAHLARIGR